MADALDKYLAGETSGPTGAGQTRQGATGDGSALDSWLNSNGYTTGANTWYTGANTQGTNNGWDNQFTEDFQNQWNKALEDGTARNFFDASDATGVVTWDHTTEGGKTLKFGDVYRNGKYEGNLYEDHSETDADLMMAPWILDGKTQNETFGASDAPQRLRREILAQREDRNENFADFLTQQEFQGKVDDREAQFHEDGVDKAIMGGGAVGGAAVGAGAGAALGSVVPILGTTIGAVAGGAIGGATGWFGAWANQDSLTEQAARAYEITSAANDEHGTVAGITTGAAQWSGFGGRLIAPLSNTVQGGYELSQGLDKVGDQNADFYAVDESGDRKAGAWWRGADFAGALGDSVLQFASPTGATLFMASTGTNVGGQVTSLIATGGETFDYRTGTFDNIFTDDDGRFDLSSGAAGLGIIGIDAVQMLGGRGLMSKADNSALIAGPGAKAVDGRAAGYGAFTERGRALQGWAGDKVSSAKEALGFRSLAEGTEEVSVAGWTYVRDKATGAIVEDQGRRLSVQMFAPSEFITSTSATLNAMRMTGKARGALTADDLYRGAMSLQDKKLANTLVTAFGEGAEEAVQELLEPLSHSDSLSYEDALQAMESGAMGFAAGAGMGIGSQLRSSMDDGREFALVKTGYALQTGLELTRDEYKNMDAEARLAFKNMPALDRTVADTAAKNARNRHMTQLSAGVEGLHRVSDAAIKMRDSSLKTAAVRTDQAFVITQTETLPRIDEATGQLVSDLDPNAQDVPADAVGMSLNQFGSMMEEQRKGMSEQVADLRRRMSETTEDADAAALGEHLAHAELTLEWSDRINEALAQQVEELGKATDLRTAEIETNQLNYMLRRLFNAELSASDFGITDRELTDADRLAIQRASSVVYVREPRDQSGSYQVLLPQVSARLTTANADNVLQISHAILQSLGGDFDGDKIRSLHQLSMSPTQFLEARIGMHFLGADHKVNIGIPAYEEYNVSLMSRALRSRNLTLKGFANLTLDNIEKQLERRYSSYVAPGAIAKAMDAFRTQVLDNNTEARDTLMSELARSSDAIHTRGRERLTNEWLWIDQLVVSELQKFQESYAANGPKRGRTINEVATAEPHARTTHRPRTVEPTRGPTAGVTLSTVLEGSAIFRKFQKIHYSTLNSPMLAQLGWQRSTPQELAELYTELGQLTTESTLDQVLTGDPVIDGAYSALEALAREANKMHPNLRPFEALATIANLEVANLELDAAGNAIGYGPPITLAQLLLKQQLMKVQRENAHLLADNEPLRTRLATLEQLTKPNASGSGYSAEMAFVEITSAQQIFTLLGDQSDTLPSNLTMGQFVRELMSMTPEQRRAELQLLRGSKNYASEQSVGTPPYSLDSLTQNHLTAYRAVVDAIAGSANGQLTVDEQGRVSGTMVRRNEMASRTFREGVTQAREAIAKYMQLDPKDSSWGVEAVQTALNADSRLKRAVLNLVSDSAAKVGFRIDPTSGEVFVANWVYEMLAISDPAHAEMFYWSSLAQAEWLSLSSGLNFNDDEPYKAVQYDRLPSMISRTFYRLASKQDGGLAMAEFLQKMNAATNIDAFFQEMNRTGWAGDKMPQLPWVNDVAEFDAEKAKGGWSSASEGSRLREAIQKFKAAAGNFERVVDEDLVGLESDSQVKRLIDRYTSHLAKGGSRETADADAREAYDKVERLLAQAEKHRVSLGPHQMVEQAIGAAKMFYAKAHTKGVDPAHTLVQGQHDTLRDGVGFVSAYTRYVESQTAAGLNDTLSNLTFAATKGYRTVDATGRQIVLEMPSVSEFVEMLVDPATRGAAQELAYPTVHELGMDGNLVSQFLHAPVLNEHMEKAAYKDLFPKEEKLSDDAAFRYLSQIQGIARDHDGVHEVQKFVDDLVAARVAGLRHEASDSEIRAIVMGAYRETARALQSSGAFATRFNATPEGREELRKLKSEIADKQRGIRRARGMGLLKSGDEALDELYLDILENDKHEEHNAEMKALLTSISAAQQAGDRAKVKKLEEARKALEAELDNYRERLELLQQDDLVQQTIDMLHYNPSESPSVRAAKQQAMVEYILGNPGIFNPSRDALALLTRVTTSLDVAEQALGKAVSQISQGEREQFLDLEPAEWEELSRAIIAVYLTDTLSVGARGVTVAPFPKLDSADTRYYDTSYMYLAEPLLDPEHPLLRAAMELHARADAPMVPQDPEDVRRIIENTILDPELLGAWTPVIVDMSTEATSRRLSAAAEPGISMVGNAPKQQQVFMGAMRRTTRVPSDDMLSTSQLTLTELEADEWNAVAVAHPNGTVASMPLAQLRGRFAKQAAIVQVAADGTETVLGDLLQAVQGAGRVWNHSSEVARSGFQAVQPANLALSLRQYAEQAGVPASTLRLDVTYAHPDMQPASVDGEVWANNVFFEGLGFESDADHYDSLVQGFWFSPAGYSSSAQASALDAAKKGRAAIKSVLAASRADRNRLEDSPWAENDPASAEGTLAAMLRLKALEVISTSLDVALTGEHLNHVYKDLKFRHFVKLTNPETGARELWTADKVIAWQASNPGVALQGAELWVPSDEFLRTVLGDQTGQGILPDLLLDMTIDPSTIETFVDLPADFLDQYPGVMEPTGSLREVNASLQRKRAMRVSNVYADDGVQRRTARLEYFNGERNRIHAARAESQFDAKASFRSTFSHLEQSLQLENLTLVWAQLGLPFGAKTNIDTEVQSRLLQDLETARSTEYSERAGWIYDHKSASNPLAGRITRTDLSAEGPLSIAPFDLVAVDLGSFDDTEAGRKEARDVLRQMTKRGAYIILSTSGNFDARAEMSEFLSSEGLEYQRIPGTSGVFQPRALDARSQSDKARESMLVETRGLQWRNRAATFLVDGKGIWENAALINIDSDRVAKVAVTADLIPVDYARGFNVPTPSSVGTKGQVSAVKEFLASYDDKLDTLLEMSNGHIKDEKRRADEDSRFIEAWERLRQRLDRQGTVLPQPGEEFGTGDLIPLVDQKGRVILYRHGYTAPNKVDREKQMNSPRAEGSDLPANISVYSSDPEKDATSHRGVVRTMEPHPQYGLRVVLEVDYQTFGDKRQLEFDGVKYVVTPWNKDRLPIANGGQFMPGVDIDMVSDYASYSSKGGGRGLVVNFRNAFAHLGFDFRADLAEILFPNEGVAAAVAAGNEASVSHHIERAVTRLRTLHRQVHATGSTITPATAARLLSSARPGQEIRQLLTPLAAANSDLQVLLDGLPDEATSSPSAQIVRGMIISVMAGIHPDSILQGGSINDRTTDANAYGVEMPRLFTEYLDLAPFGSPLRKELFDRLNAQLARSGNAGEGFILHENWSFSSQMADASKNLQGFLMFSEPHSSGDNPVKNAMTFTPGQKEGRSLHSEAINYGATGAVSTALLDNKKAQRFLDGLKSSEGTISEADFWSTMTKTPPQSLAFDQIAQLTEIEQEYLDGARTAMTRYRKGITVDTSAGWSAAGQQKLDEATRGIVESIGLHGNQKELAEFWIRQLLGRPFDIVDGEVRGKIDESAALAAAEQIRWNVDHGYIPTAGGFVPGIHASDLQAIFQANSKDSVWAPRTIVKEGETRARANSWDEWVDVALGTLNAAPGQFDVAFLVETDGIMHTYMNASESTVRLPVSMDSLRDAKLADPESNALYVSVVGPKAGAMKTADMQAGLGSLNNLLGYARVGKHVLGVSQPSTEMAKRLADMKRWRKQHGVPFPMEQSIKDLRKEGVRFRTETTTTSAFIRTVINLRLGMAMLNPALFVSMGPEMWVRSALDKLVQNSQGQGTSGLTAKVHARASQLLQESDNKYAVAMSTVANQLGLTHSFTPDTLRSLKSLYQSHGQDHRFTSMMWNDLVFLNPAQAAQSKWEFAWLAKAGAKLQDPTYGVRAATLARRYLEAAIEEIRFGGTSTMSVDSLIQAQSLDPTYIKTHHPEIHENVMARIADFRSQRLTVLTKALKDTLDPLTASQNNLVNFSSNFFLKVPLMFATYAGNVAKTVTGMQFLDAWVAANLHGRATPGTWKARLQARAMGRTDIENDDATMDYNSVLEGIDLHRSFLQSGFTLTGLFTFGLMAGGIGLSGEDEEAKKRRKMAENRGLGVIYDPRKMENDYRSADSIYLDTLPFGFGTFFTEMFGDPDANPRAAVKPHWMLKQFLSPVLGFERFFETGDARHIRWGFEDAMGSFPLINGDTWKDVVATTDVLLGKAQTTMDDDSPAGIAKSVNLLTSVVSMYERMLFESSFVNSLYVGMDEYDRDPYKLPLLDSDGDIQRNILGNARPNDLALETYRDPETGEVMQGYVNRGEVGAAARTLTENRASMAFVASLFTGGIGESDFWRYNMPEKIRTQTVPEMDSEEISKILLQTWALSGGAKDMTVDEHIRALRKQANDAGVKYISNEELRPLAEERFAQTQGVTFGALGAEGVAFDPTSASAQARAVFEGLRLGTIEENSLALSGLTISYETREKIQAQWSKELVQDGMALGLDQTAAEYRMERIMRGYDGGVGLSDIIWSDQISYSTKVEYAQLNTTYTMGPQGLPVATGFARGSLLGAFGLSPVEKMKFSGQSSLTADARGNTVNLLNNTNTGMRGLELRNSTYDIPTDVEIGKSIEKAIREAKDADYSAETNNKSGGYGYGYRRRGGGGGGGGGGYFSRMYSLPRGVTPYGNTIQQINTSNPIIRRNQVRRERVWSERGRLKQWQ